MVSRDGSEGLASEAQEMGARVLRGPVPSAASEANLYLGDVEMQELLHEMAAYEVLVAIAPVGLPGQERRLCPLCRRAHRTGECPVSRAEQEEAKRSREERLLFDEGLSSLLCG
ncbi:MAG TPA: hypothetical protein ENO24_09390 [Chloroflexi bacterium]|nr:hypothetical protein [Chloroflexota bacterium]